MGVASATTGQGTRDLHTGGRTKPRTRFQGNPCVPVTSSTSMFCPLQHSLDRGKITSCRCVPRYTASRISGESRAWTFQRCLISGLCATILKQHAENVNSEHVFFHVIISDERTCHEDGRSKDKKGVVVRISHRQVISQCDQALAIPSFGFLGARIISVAAEIRRRHARSVDSNRPSLSEHEGLRVPISQPGSSLVTMMVSGHELRGFLSSPVERW
jgi:hypothetical protein